MFAKLKESKLFKSLSEALFPVPRACAKKAAAAKSSTPTTVASPDTAADSR